MGEAARAKTARLSFPATGTRRPLHRRFRFVPIPTHCRGRRWPTWNAAGRQIGSGSRRVFRVAGFSGSPILEFRHRCQSRWRDGKHSWCAEGSFFLIPPPCGEGRVGVAANSVPAAPHPTGLRSATLPTRGRDKKVRRSVAKRLICESHTSSAMAAMPARPLTKRAGNG